MKEIYVGNLLYSVTYDEIEALFSPYGTVHSVKLIAEARPKHPHAYAFVEMDDVAAEEAIRMLDGMDFFDRTLRVEEALPERELNVRKSMVAGPTE